MRATAEYQKCEQLGINTLDRINSVSNDMQHKLDPLNEGIVKMSQGTAQWTQQAGVDTQAQVAKDDKTDLIAAKLE